MTASVDGNSWQETPLWIPAGRHELFAIETAPAQAPRGIGVVYASAGSAPSPDRNRMIVRLARRLAAAGFHFMRFDYHNIAESPGQDAPQVLYRLCTRDVLAVVASLRQRGVSEIVLMGSCFGARNVLSAAGRVAGLRGVLMITMPLMWWKDTIGDKQTRGLPTALLESPTGGLRRRWRGVLRAAYFGARGWVDRPWPIVRSVPRGQLIDPSVEAGLRALMRRRVPLMLLMQKKHAEALEAMRLGSGATLEALLAPAGEWARIVMLGGHAYSERAIDTAATQDAVLACVEDWVGSVASTADTPQNNLVGA